MAEQRPTGVNNEGRCGREKRLVQLLSVRLVLIRESFVRHWSTSARRSRRKVLGRLGYWYWARAVRSYIKWAARDGSSKTDLGVWMIWVWKRDWIYLRSSDSQIVRA